MKIEQKFNTFYFNANPSKALARNTQSYERLVGVREGVWGGWNKIPSVLLFFNYRNELYTITEEMGNL